jgi:hypothetical protein
VVPMNLVAKNYLTEFRQLAAKYFLTYTPNTISSGQNGMITKQMRICVGKLYFLVL